MAAIATRCFFATRDAIWGGRVFSKNFPLYGGLKFLGGSKRGWHPDIDRVLARPYALLHAVDT